MGNAGPGVLGSMLFLMLGLQPLPLSRGRSLHHPPNSRSFHLGSRHHGSTWEKLKSCEGAFDLYFIVDASQKAKDIWEDICQLVDEITTKYTNPDLRMSFITYSTQGRIVMKLTSDRTKIRDGLKRLQDIVPTGATNMQEGLKEANKQIQQATSGDRNTSSLIITLTAGPLLPRTLQDTKKEAQQARDMGAKVYCVGVKDYERDQLNDIVERKDQMYGTEEFNSAETFVTSLVKNSCMEAMAGDTHFVCSGVAYEVTFFASGLDEKRKDEIVCRYQLGSGKVFDEKPISMNQGKLICPGHIFDKAGQEVFIDYSLNNGVSFIGEDLKIVSKDCVNDRVGLREPQWTAAWEEETEDAGASWEEEVIKEPPSAQRPEKPCPAQTTVIVSCCECQEDRISQMEGKLDVFYHFLQRCSLVPLMRYPTRDMGRCPSFALMNPHCAPMLCGPKICPQPRQECFPLNSCSSHWQHHQPIRTQSFSRFLPLSPPTANKLCRSPLSLPPP